MPTYQDEDFEEQATATSTGTGGFREMGNTPDGMTVVAGNTLSSDTVTALVAVVNQHGTVSSPNKLGSKIQEGLVAIYHQRGGVAGTATLKDQSDKYQRKVQERSRVNIPAGSRELSYFGGNAGAVAECVKALVAEAPGPIYATVISNDTGGITALSNAGFRKMGKAYASRTKPGQSVLFYARSA